MATVSANRLELLQIADAVAREKVIDRDIVLDAMEEAIQKAARSRYGSETDIRAEIDPKTGELRLSRLLLVVDQVENDATQIALADAAAQEPGGPGRRLHRRAPAAASTSAASPPRPPSRSSCRRCARPSATASTRSTRTASARSSTAWSSASSTATSSSTSAAARASCAATS